MERGDITPYKRDREELRSTFGDDLRSAFNDDLRSTFDSLERMHSNMLMPFKSLDPLQNFDALWNDGPMRSLVRDARAVAGTKVDWKETKDEHVFKADLPGLSKDDVKVTVEDGRTLRITGERSKEKEEKTDTWHRVERSQGRFLRQFNLPESARVDDLRARVENGVLTVTVPKLDRGDKSKHRCIDVQ